MRVHPFSCMGRHRHGGRGFGFAGFMGGDRLGGFRAGRKLASGDLQLIVLALLAEKPCHGYEIIKALEDKSGGFYTPSPGMVYPALTYLEEVGHTSVEAEGNRKLYSITDAGREYLDKNRDEADAMLSQLDWMSRKMAHVRRVFGGDETGEEESEESAYRAAGHREVWQAIRDLRAALRERRRDSTAKERDRIVAALRRAAEDIRGHSRQR
jgi:DNA-binding PadR family transcriptional regulator